LHYFILFPNNLFPRKKQYKTIGYHIILAAPQAGRSRSLACISKNMIGF